MPKPKPPVVIRKLMRANVDTCNITGVAGTYFAVIDTDLIGWRANLEKEFYFVDPTTTDDIYFVSLVSREVHRFRHWPRVIRKMMKKPVVYAKQTVYSDVYFPLFGCDDDLQLWKLFCEATATSCGGFMYKLNRHIKDEGSSYEFIFHPERFQL